LCTQDADGRGEIQETPLNFTRVKQVRNFEPHQCVVKESVKKAVLLALVLSSFASVQAATPKYILFLTCDGFRTDYIEWYQPPNIKKLIANGTRVIHATNVFPTLTTPNMTSLVTGSYPRTTTIAANDEYDRETDQIIHGARHNEATTIGETLRKARWTTAAANHFMLKHDVSFYVSPGYDESDATTTAVLDLLSNKHANFVAAIYGAADHAGHRHGPHSAEVKEAVLGIDAAIGRLIEGLKRLGIYEQTAIAFTADHGMSEFEKKATSSDPREALKKAGFRVATKEEELKPDTQIVALHNGVCIVYFRKASEAEKQKAIAVLRGIKGAELLDRAALDALGCHNNHSGDIAVSPLPGYTLTHAGKSGGQHGRFPENNPVMFFSGCGIKHGASLQGGRNVDVVPTLLSMVDVKPAPSVDGHVLPVAAE
jgi:predicted AlkP superfamily pyrophosphatase or phosphodiesterase